MSEKVTLSSQAAAVELLLARGAVRKVVTRNQEAQFLEAQVQAAITTLRWMQANEAEIRKAVKP